VEVFVVKMEFVVEITVVLVMKYVVVMAVAP